MRTAHDNGCAMDDNIDIAHVKRVLETALLTTQEPLTQVELKKLFDDIGHCSDALLARCALARYADHLTHTFSTPLLP